MDSSSYLEGEMHNKKYQYKHAISGYGNGKGCGFGSGRGRGMMMVLGGKSVAVCTPPGSSNDNGTSRAYRKEGLPFVPFELTLEMAHG
jgi:hypothetical protein